MRTIDADKMREEWLDYGENEYVYDTNAVLDSIDNQPTIEPYGTWIPCNDDTPVKEGKYIVTTKKGSVYCAKGGKYGFHTDMHTHIIAYMPLPLPYREEKKDE